MRDRMRALAGRNASRGMAARRAAFTFCLAVSAAAISAPATAQDFRFDTIRIEGNERVTDQTITGQAEISPGQALSASEVNDGYQRLVETGLFEDVEFVPDGNTLVIRVSEYPVIDVINFEGNDRIDDDDLREAVQSQQGRPFSPSTAESDASELATLYRQRGRYAAEVTPRIIPRSGNRASLVFEVNEGATTEVERVSFVGNREYSDRRLRRAIETKQAGLLRSFISRDRFAAERVDADRDALRDFYLARGYLDFEVLSATPEMSQERDAFFLTFNIREGQSFDIAGTDVRSEIQGVEAAPFREELRLRSGTTYSPARIENAITRLERVADRQGLRFVEVEPSLSRNETAGTVDVTFVLRQAERLFVERIDIRGNTNPRDSVIRRHFDTVEGDPFNPRELTRAADRIRDLEYIGDAQVRTEEGSADDQVVVVVDVEEQPSGSIGFGVSYGIDAGLGGVATFREANLFGRGQELDISLGFGTDTQDTSITFTEPYFLDRDLELSASAYWQETERFNAAYNTRNIGVETSLGFPVSEQGRLSLRYRVSRDSLRGVSDESSAVLQREEGFGDYTSSVGYTYRYDTREAGLNPVMDYYLRFRQDFAGLGGDQRYIKSTALAGVERRIMSEEVTLRAELEGGNLSMIDGDSRVLERFALNREMRGFQFNGIGPRDFAAENEDALGGNNFIVARFEADFPLGLPEEYGIDGGLFLDVGTTWGLDNTDGAELRGSDDFSLRSAVGFSVFWDTPIGPLRFDFSRALLKEDFDEERNFDLTVSTRF